MIGGSGGTPNLTKQTDNLNIEQNTVTINTTIQNNGTATASASQIGYYLSLSPTFSTLDYPIGTDNLPILPIG